MRKKDLVWVYPPNNWVSNYKKTFVYGWSNPRARLFINNTKIKIFPSGNFAQSIRLLKKKNLIKLIQILNNKKRVSTRLVIARSVSNEAISQKRHRSGEIASPSARNDMIVVIDPGHGGKEHGTHSPKGIPEKVFNLQIAKMLVGAFRETPLHGKIYLTRSRDKFISLKERVNFAKKKKATILISIHHNALSDNENPLKHRGVGIYYTHDFAKPLARALLKSISCESGLKQYGTFKRNFALTRPDFCYAVLIECGFLIHPIEAEIVMKRSTQEKIIRGIVKLISKQGSFQ